MVVSRMTTIGRHRGSADVKLPVDRPQLEGRPYPKPNRPCAGFAPKRLVFRTRSENQGRFGAFPPRTAAATPTKIPPHWSHGCRVSRETRAWLTELVDPVVTRGPC